MAEVKEWGRSAVVGVEMKAAAVVMVEEALAAVLAAARVAAETVRGRWSPEAMLAPTRCS